MLFNRRTFLIGILPFSACGFEPLYGEAKITKQILNQINVEVSKGRNSFELRDRLIDRVGIPSDSAKYMLRYKTKTESKNLTISRDNDVTRYTLLGETSFQLTHIGSQRVIYENTVISNTAYSATAGTYPTRVAERDANIRLSKDMADKIITLLFITAEEWIE
ncbi:LPS assembly lipoprotein LptE [Amylibacter sp.]|nr:LPS assembly lipoprotein LptE [Amylibacter sp.]MDC1455606.1 LPS assembly lipoprotein LptE [Amylibacter sp.]